MRIEVNEPIVTWEQVEALPEDHQTHPPEDPLERARLAELVTREIAVRKTEDLMRQVLGMQNAVDTAHSMSFDAMRELVRTRGGRPKGKTRRSTARRVKGSLSHVYYPLEITKNPTLGDTAKAIYPLVLTLSHQRGYMWASYPALARMTWGEYTGKGKRDKRGEKIGKALRELESAGYIRMTHKSTGSGDTNKWEPVDLGLIKTQNKV